MLRPYSFGSVYIVCGIHTVKEYADGDHLTIAFEGAELDKKQGPHGGAAVSFMPNNFAIATIRILQGSPSNEFFSLWAEQQRTLVRPVLKPFMVKDNNSLTTIINTRAAALQKIADMGYSSEAGVREWELLLHLENAFIGTNLFV